MIFITYFRIKIRPQNHSGMKLLNWLHLRNSLW